MGLSVQTMFNNIFGIYHFLHPPPPLFHQITFTDPIGQHIKVFQLIFETFTYPTSLMYCIEIEYKAIFFTSFFA